MHPLLSEDPWKSLELWYREAEAAGESMVDAMALATVDAKGQPRARIVLYKGIIEGKVAFFTNYRSPKALEIGGNPRVALTFHFRSLTRQVRLEGCAVKLSAEASDAYFATRPRESQIGAWASPQSEVIATREELERRTDEVRARFGQGAVPRPDFWGGFGVEVERFEFWLGAEFRLHDRFVYTPAGVGWRGQRLAP
ncbi:MAG: pyridoxamine 5'-phosphate oxidase [Polyangiaceae bacterium]|nr:pyridoxamine 5'-phosphate oxidase [Polyangiaceae bacterium]